jgi:hypothetical protein
MERSVAAPLAPRGETRLSYSTSLQAKLSRRYINCASFNGIDILTME